MILITPDKGSTELTELVASLGTQLRDLRGELEKLQTGMRSGEADDLKQAVRTISEIRHLLRLSIETELKLYENNKREKGIVHEYAIDLAAAKSSIGCRLDRLRKTCCKGRVPEEPDQG